MATWFSGREKELTKSVGGLSAEEADVVKLETRINKAQLSKTRQALYELLLLRRVFIGGSGSAEQAADRLLDLNVGVHQKVELILLLFLFELPQSGPIFRREKVGEVVEGGHLLPLTASLQQRHQLAPAEVKFETLGEPQVKRCTERVGVPALHMLTL
ncbi:hypothetical protein TYRP_005772 [Tyrophagus putrescentiae]|nr:hypothetical protein TYRP_005772 [Tyrophagus putrescentiae]